MRVRDIRKAKFFWAQNELFDVFAPFLGPLGGWVYMALCRTLPTRPDGKVSLRELADEAQVKKDTVRRSLSMMVTLGMVAEQRKGPKAAAVWLLLDLSEAAAVGKEELERRASVAVRDSLTRKLPLGGDTPSVAVADSFEPPGDRFPATDTPLFGDRSVAQNAPVSEFKKKEEKTGERPRAREAVSQEQISLICLSHPYAVARGWREADVSVADSVAVRQAVRAEIEATGCAEQDAAEMILRAVQQLARDLPTGEWRYLKPIDRYMSLREYRMDPALLGGTGGTYGSTEQHRPANGNGARPSPAVQRGIDSRQTIGAAVERARARRAGRADG